MIETNQGIAGTGRVFGYDHSRFNWIEWTHIGGRLTVAVVENDSEEEMHGSLAATRREAMVIAARHNRKPPGCSNLLAAVLDAAKAE